jgi:hypothetical protein
MSDEKNKYNKAYDEGYNEGKKDDLLQNFAQSLTKGYKMPVGEDKVR